MPRFTRVLLISILIIIYLASPALAPTTPERPLTNDFDKVFRDIVADYALLNSLLQDVRPLNQYNISLHADNPDSAISYLSQGFSPSLAQAIVGCYLKWLPEVNKLVIIPTDSIPLITGADKNHLSMQRISPDKVILDRIYTNCYEIGDRYLYRITAQQRESRWVIVDLQLDPL